MIEGDNFNLRLGQQHMNLVDVLNEEETEEQLNVLKDAIDPLMAKFRANDIPGPEATLVGMVLAMLYPDH